MATKRFDTAPHRRDCGFTDAQKLLIKQRDFYACQHNCELTRNCGGPNGELTVHHIVSRQRCRELGIDPNTLGNGITLCSAFHNSLHRRGCPDGLNWNPTYDTDLRSATSEANRRLLSGQHNEFRPYARKLGIRKFVARIFGGWGKLGTPRP